MTRAELENEISRRCEEWVLKRSPFVQSLSEEEQAELLAAQVVETFREQNDPESVRALFEIFLEREAVRMRSEGEL